MDGMSQETISKMKDEFTMKKNQPKQGGIYWSPQDGEAEIRILPSGTPDKFFYKGTAMHSINETQYFCPKFTDGSRCPICEAVAKLWKSNTPEDITLARSLKARKKYYTNAIIRLKEGDKGPMIWTFGQKMFDKILTYIFDPDFGDVTNLTTGYDFKVIRKLKDGYPNYDDSKPRKNASKAGTPEQITEWMSRLHDINLVVTKDLKSYTELKALLINTEEPEAEESLSMTPPPVLTAQGKITPIIPQELIDELKAMKGK